MPKHTNLKEAREKRKRRQPNKWTLEKVSEKLDISVNYLTKLENGTVNNPSIDLLNDFIKLYGNEDGKKILQDFFDIEFVPINAKARRSLYNMLKKEFEK